MTKERKKWEPVEESYEREDIDHPQIDPQQKKMKKWNIP